MVKHGKGAEQTQEQFFNIFNELHQKGKQIIITSDKQPKELNPLEERLRSRLEWGMLADISVPDIETKIAILNKKAQQERYNVSREVIEYIAELSTSNIRTMEGYLSRAVFYSSLQKEDIVTLQTAREALKDIAKEDEETIDVQEQNYNILKDVLDHYASLGETEEIMKELALAGDAAGGRSPMNIADTGQVRCHMPR